MSSPKRRSEIIPYEAPTEKSENKPAENVAERDSEFNERIARFMSENEKAAAENEQKEQRMSRVLSKKDFEKWKSSKNSAWGKMITTIPFESYREPAITIESAKETFKGRIVGRESEKEEMMRKVASFINSGRFRRPLLLVGAPGEGKSCFAQCLAKSLGYPIHYINMPTIGSPIALVGSEQHYSNSRIGEILQALIDEETLSVVFVFDEIDKLNNHSDEGSVESVLLQLFDPLWNGMFTDRSACIPVDLSHCVFICTANDDTAMSYALLDRLDVIRFDSYSEEQALRIINEMTIPSVISASNMTKRIRFADDVAPAIIASVDNGSMRDYEKMVEKLVDNALYVMLSEHRKTYTVKASDLDVIIPSDKRRAMGFGC